MDGPVCKMSVRKIITEPAKIEKNKKTGKPKKTKEWKTQARAELLEEIFSFRKYALEKNEADSGNVAAFIAICRLTGRRPEEVAKTINWSNHFGTDTRGATNIVDISATFQTILPEDIAGYMLFFTAKIRQELEINPLVETKPVIIFDDATMPEHHTHAKIIRPNRWTSIIGNATVEIPLINSTERQSKVKSRIENRVALEMRINKRTVTKLFDISYTGDIRRFRNNDLANLFILNHQIATIATLPVGSGIGDTMKLTKYWLEQIGFKTEILTGNVIENKNSWMRKFSYQWCMIEDMNGEAKAIFDPDLGVIIDQNLVGIANMKYLYIYKAKIAIPACENDENNKSLEIRLLS